MAAIHDGQQQSGLYIELTIFILLSFGQTNIFY